MLTTPFPMEKVAPVHTALSVAAVVMTNAIATAPPAHLHFACVSSDSSFISVVMVKHPEGKESNLQEKGLY